MQLLRSGVPSHAPHKGNSGLRRLMLGCALLGLSASGETLAQAAATPVGQGQVLEARPTRSQDGRRVEITYAVQLTGAPLRPGMLLTVTRPTQYGRAEGPPYLQVGWMRVLATADGVAIARSLPAQGGDREILSPPVPIVSDILRPEASLKQVAPGGAGVELSKLFPAGTAVPGPEAGAILNELARALGPHEQVLVAVYYSGSPSVEALNVAWEQARWVAGQVTGPLGLDETALHPVIMPLPPETPVPRAELRPLPTRGGEDRNRAEPRREAPKPPPEKAKPAPEKPADKAAP